MAYVIQHDEGEGNAPSFLHKVEDATVIWGTLTDAQQFEDESLAQSVIDVNNLMDAITLPFDVEVFSGE